MHRSFGRALAVAVGVGALISGATALAQGQGVHVDPDTPAGKEYALPLEQARQDAAPPQSEGSSDPAAAPLFGEGISKRGGKAETHKKRAAGSAATSRDGPQDTVDRGSSSLRSIAQSTSSSGPSSGLISVLIALGVLAVGGMVGLGLRSLRRSDPAA